MDRPPVSMPTIDADDAPADAGWIREFGEVGMRASGARALPA